MKTLIGTLALVVFATGCDSTAKLAVDVDAGVAAPSVASSASVSAPAEDAAPEVAASTTSSASVVLATPADGGVASVDASKDADKK